MVPTFTNVVASLALVLLYSLAQVVRSQSLSLRQWAGNENQGSIIGLTSNDKPPPDAFANQEVRPPFIGNDRNFNSGDIRNGSVRFFRKEQGSSASPSNELTNLTLFGNSLGGDFGHAISLSGDGNRVAIGAISSGNVGSVSVYEMVNEAWGLLGVIPGEVVDSIFGYSVSLSKDGSRVAIGDRLNTRRNAGYGRVYEWNGSSFLKLGANIDRESISGGKTPSDIALSEDGLVVAIGALCIDVGFGSYFTGVSVALSGDGNIVAVGINKRVQVFEWKDAEWIQVGQTLKDLGGQIYSGESVSLSSSGSVLALGSDRVAPQVYILADGTWLELGGIIGSFGGHLVSLSSDGFTLAVGDWRSDSVSIYNLNELLETTTPTPSPSAISGPTMAHHP
ncbi:unnamed protein product [Cylindrotheca closterium]|uniref:Uncharacterized protein n=1 Tax=Cylindrotheca closterium TaxID=2856 RepID=A0AAD2GC00_9STRA|nr:unnamed protein product [Cylindrotheca closterium]